MVLLSLPKGGFIPKSATGLMVFIWGGGHISLGGWRTANAQSVSLVNQVAIISNTACWTDLLCIWSLRRLSLHTGILGLRQAVPLSARNQEVIAAELDDDEREKIGVGTRLPLNSMQTREALQSDCRLVNGLGSDLNEEILVLNATSNEQTETASQTPGRNLLIDLVIRMPP